MEQSQRILIEEKKSISNKIFGFYDKHLKGQCTYDRALELSSDAISDFAFKEQSHNIRENARVHRENAEKGVELKKLKDLHNQILAAIDKEDFILVKKLILST